jgi:DNA polymerase-1
MRSLVFDIEGNGLLDTVTKVHCIAAADTKTGERMSWGPNEIPQALETLYDADELIAHYGLSYDFPALAKLHNWHHRPGCRRIDTVVVSRLLHPNLKQDDQKRYDFPPRLLGSHSLKAWGIRLGVFKGEYGTDEKGKPIPGIWDEWTEKMQTYMEQDVEVNLKLLQHLRPWEYPRLPLDLEHRAAEVCAEIERNGWPFDIKAAQQLYCELVGKRDEIEKSLVAKFGSWQEVDRVVIPKRDNKRLGYKVGEPVTHMKTVTFNPGSRVHIEKKLREAGWEPKEFTEGGRAQLDEEILSRLDIPEAKPIIDYLLVQKRLGQLGDGSNGWLQIVNRDGRIHGAYNPCGTLTGRAAHYNPNISQVPAVRAPYGKECRSLFGAPDGWKLVGADMAGLELRTFAHYLSFYDEGEYIKVVTEGDVHTFNQQAAGLETRDQAKTFIYALLYGAGDEKIGLIAGGGSKRGRALKEKFFATLPAYDKLTRKIALTVEQNGCLKGLDGRKLHIRSKHSALNTLLQSAGAILCKQWMVSFDDQMQASGYTGADYFIVGWIHDELQVAVREGLEKTVGAILVGCARRAGKPFGFKVPLDSSYTIGSNWAETH